VCLRAARGLVGSAGVFYRVNRGLAMIVSTSYKVTPRGMLKIWGN